MYTAGYAALLVLAVTASVPSGMAATPSLSYLSEWPGYVRGSVRAMVVTNDIAYLAAVDAGLICVDVSNPREMVRIGQVPRESRLDTYYDVGLRGNYAFAAAWQSGLRVIDVSNPRSPVSVAQTNMTTLGNQAVSVAVEGDVAVVGGFSGSLEFFDISIPTEPKRLGSSSVFGSPSGNNDLAVLNQFAFLAEGTTGLTIADYFNARRPTRLRGINTPGSAGGVVVEKGYAYIADGTTGLLVYDVSALPAVPRAVATYKTPAATDRVAYDNGRAFVGMGLNGIEAVDVREPGSPVRLGRHSTPGTVTALAVQGSSLFIGHREAPLEAVDWSDPSAPKILGRLGVSGDTSNVAVRGTNAFVADGGDGLRIFDLENPQRPVLKRTLSELGDVRRVLLSGDLAIVATGFAGVRILNVTRPLEPVLLGGFATPGEAWDLAVTNSRLFVVERFGDVRILDISNPESPKEVGSIGQVFATGIALNGSHALVSTSSKGLIVYDVADPSAPKRLDPPVVTGGLNSVAVYGDLGFTVGGSYVTILDVRDAAQPVVRGRIPASFGERVTYDGRYAYVASGANGIKVHDLSDLTAPVPVAEFVAPNSWSVDVTVVGRTVLVGDRVFGLRILDFGEPQGTQAPQLAIGWESGLPQISLTGSPGVTMEVQFRDDVASAGWQRLTQVTLTSERTVVKDDAPAAQQRFYRAQTLEVTQPPGSLVR